MSRHRRTHGKRPSAPINNRVPFDIEDFDRADRAEPFAFRGRPRLPGSGSTGSTGMLSAVIEVWLSTRQHSSTQKNESSNVRGILPRGVNDQQTTGYS
jgi:hypothetical protein